MADISFSVSYWTLFHSLLRDEKGGSEENNRARAACAWMTAELTSLRRCCTPDEADLLGDIYESWRGLDHKEAPSYALVKQRVITSSSPAKEEWLRDYEELSKELPRLHAEDLGGVLTTKFTEFRDAKVALALKNSLKILVDGADVKDPNTGRKEKQKGSNDAIRYLMSRMDMGFGSPTTNPTHGVLHQDVSRVKHIYQEIMDPTITKGRVIATGLSTLDKDIKVRKGQFVGILGFAGSGKTRMGRTWCYHAATLGFHVLHISLEQTFEEELIRYALIHSHAPFWGLDTKGKPRGISISAYENGKLTDEERAFLYDEVIPDIRDHVTIPGRLTLRQPSDGNTWDAIKILAAVTDRTHPLDMVFIDDISLVTPRSPRHAVEETNANIQDAKTWAMGFNDNEGLLVVTPVQGSRSGYEAAQKAHGRWDMSGVYMYSQFDKALDLCYSVYSDDDLDAESKIVLGTAKHRRGKNLPPTKVAVNHGCGTFHDLNVDRAVRERALEAALEDL